MELLAFYRSAINHFDSRVRAIRGNQWELSTPDTEWSVRDLVNHVVSEHLWVPELMCGATILEVGDKFDGDVLGDDPTHAWTNAAAASRSTWEVPGAAERTVHLSFGDVVATVYGWQLITDLLVHGWDLSAAINVDDNFPNDLVGAVLRQVQEAGDHEESGMFAPALDVSACTDDLTELLARLGRRRPWTR